MRRNTTDLVGRGALLERARTTHRDHALVALVGPPGVGKTALARQLRVAQGRWIRLVGARGEPEVLARLREGLEMPDASRAELVGALSGPILLDGAEGVPSTLLAEMAMSGASVLITTRRDPKLRSAHVVFVEPLSCDSDGQGSPAARLLWQMVRARGLEVSWEDAHTRAELERLATMLSGLPSALELAASRCRALGLAGLIHHLATDLSVLEQRLCDLSTRQHSLTRMLSEVWAELSSETRAATFQCAVYDGPFEVEEIVEAMGVPLALALDVLEPLIERGVMRARSTPTGTKFSLLGVMRRFARELPEYAEQTHQARLRYHEGALERAASAVAQTRRDPSLDAQEIPSWLELSEPSPAALAGVMMHTKSVQRARRARRAWRAGEDAWCDALMARFEVLYAQTSEAGVVDATERSRALGHQGVGLEDVGEGWSDPLGEALSWARAALQLGRLEDAERSIQGSLASLGGEPHGVRGAQCLGLEVELRVRQGRLAEAARLARSGVVAATPLGEAWCRAMAWSLLLTMVPMLTNPEISRERVLASWRVAGLRVPQERWSEVVGPLSTLAPVLRVLGMKVESVETSRAAELTHLLSVTLAARLEETLPSQGALSPWIAAWQSVESGDATGFEVLVTQTVRACLGHERLHSLADQLHEDQPQITIDLKEHRFRVGRQGWVGFGHRPRAMRLIARLTCVGETGAFDAVAAPELIEHVWPGEQIRYDSAQARLYNLIANVRKLGLGDVLVHDREGYRWDPGALIHVLT